MARLSKIKLLVLKTEPEEIELIDKGIDKANGIVAVNTVFKF